MAAHTSTLRRLNKEEVQELSKLRKSQLSHSSNTQLRPHTTFSTPLPTSHPHRSSQLSHPDQSQPRRPSPPHSSSQKTTLSWDHSEDCSTSCSTSTPKTTPALKSSSNSRASSQTTPRDSFSEVTD